jgi:hypothetical protein
MARKQNNAAARQRKQKIIVAVGFVLLAGLMVIQGPKLLDAFGGGGSTAAPAADESTEATPAAGTENGATAAPPPAHVTAPKSAQAELAGVIIIPEQPVKPGDGQLGSFSRFDSKDLFVQRVKDEILAADAATSAPAGQAAPQAAKPAKDQGKGNAGASTGGMVVGSDAAPDPLPTMAMLKVNGNLVTLEQGKRFPRGDGAFMLKTLKRGSVGISVADGEFAGGGVLSLRLGRKVTLINTATGARYVVQLVLLGNEENVTRFSSK